MTIILASSGSGGHLVPALKVAEELKHKKYDVVFIGSFQALGQKQIQEHGYTLHNLDMQGMAYKGFRYKIQASYLLIKAFFKARGLLKQYKPGAVLGFGGYGSVPLVLAAKMLGISTMIHEQNVIPGKANKLLSQHVNKVAISFQKTESFFKNKNMILTGCPSHLPKANKDRRELLNELGLQDNKITLLILGGSQGSRRINEEVSQSLVLVKEKLDIQVIHICGKSDYQRLNEHYKKIGIPFALYEYFDKMNYAYLLADLAICRAGAVTLTEIMMYEIPALLIPYPHAGGHQLENAKVLADAQVAQIVEEDQLTQSKICEFILTTNKNQMDAQLMHKQFESIRVVDAAQRLAKETESLVHV